MNQRIAICASTVIMGVLGLVACRTLSWSSVLDQQHTVAGCEQMIESEEIGTPCHAIDKVVMDIGNVSAFEQKLKLIDGAKTSIDVAYFIYTFDHSSSAFQERLLAKAADGVRVRILLDALMAMPFRHDLSALIRTSERLRDERLAADPNSKAKAIEVRLVRPMHEEVWKDLHSWGFDDRKAFGEAMASYEKPNLGQMLLLNSYLRDTPSFHLMVGLLLPGSVPPAEMMSVFKDAAINVPTEASIEGVLNSLFGAAVQNHAAQQPTFHPGAWLTSFKRFHHKLLLVDGKGVQGGGRNIEDAYHLEAEQMPSFTSPPKAAFMDADFYLDDEAIGAAAQLGFDSYWNCLPDAAGALGPDCHSKIPAEQVVADASEGADTFAATLHARAKKFNDLSASELHVPAIHQGTFKAVNAPVAYLENRMHPVRPTLSIEEPSRYNSAWASLMNTTVAGQEIIVHNPYIYFTPRIMRPLAQAVRRGVKVTIITNSMISAPQGFIAHIAKVQFRYLMAVAQETHPDQDLVKVYEYVTSTLNLHAKVEVVGDYLIVGATNADPRSEFLDTQNGIAIGPNAGGGSIAADYRAWLKTLLAREDILRRLTLQEVQAWVPPINEEMRQCPIGVDPQKTLLCYIGYLVDISAESDDLVGKATNAFLSAMFIML